MHLHCGLGRAEVSPWKYRETQIDRCGVQSVDRVRKLQFKRLGSIQVPRSANQDLREISPDTPVSRFIGISQRGTRHCFSQSHMVELSRLYGQTSFNVAKAFSPSYLCKSHHAKCSVHGSERTRAFPR